MQPTGFGGVITIIFIFLNIVISSLCWYIYSRMDEMIRIRNSELYTQWDKLLADDERQKNYESWDGSKIN